jgi:hypothetical protein
MVHGLVALAISGRMEKFVLQKEYIMPVMMQSLNWIINTVDLSMKKSE